MSRFEEICTDTRAIDAEERDDRIAAFVDCLESSRRHGRLASKLYIYATRAINWDTGFAELNVADIVLLCGVDRSRILLELDRLACMGHVVRERVADDLQVIRIAFPDLVSTSESRARYAQILNFDTPRSMPGHELGTKPDPQNRAEAIGRESNLRHVSREQIVAAVIGQLAQRANDNWFWFAVSKSSYRTKAEAGNYILDVGRTLPI